MWIYIPPVSLTPPPSPAPSPTVGSPSSPAQKALASASTLRRRTLDLNPLLPFATWNGKSPHAPSLRRALQTDAYARLQFGVISQPLMEECFADWLTASTGASRVRTLALRASRWGSNKGKPQGYGLSTSALLTLYGLDTSGLKTSPEFSKGKTGLGSLGNLPPSGTMRSGCLCERPTLVPRIKESGPLCWPTPNTAESKTGHGMRGGKAGNGRQSGADLTAVVRQWATPASRDYRTPNLKPYAQREGGKKGEQLSNQVAHSPFSLLSSHPDPKTGPHGLAYSEVVQTLHRLYPPEAGPRRLNPAFVDWLMGWPSDPHLTSWTDVSRAFAPGEMALWHSRALRHLSICGIE